MAMDRSVSKGSDKTLKKIGIMGGTFDPVHIAHLVIAEKAREEFGLCRVLFIPAGIPPLKKEVFAPSSERLEMVRIAIGGNGDFVLSDIEVKRKKPSYTYDTVCQIKRINPGTEVFFITGEDAFCDLPSWHRYGELAKETFFLVAPRVRKSPLRVPDIPGLRYRFIDMPLLNVSSSYIRNCLSAGKTVKYLLPEKVFEYIRRHNLYGAPSPSPPHPDLLPEGRRKRREMGRGMKGEG